MKELITKYGISVLLFLSAFFAPITATLLAIGFLIIIDTILAIWASWKNYGVKSITSRKAGRIVTKLILYPGAVIVAKVSEDYLAQTIPWVEVTTGILASVEMKSIFEKMTLLLGFDIWKSLKEVIWKPKQEDNA